MTLRTSHKNKNSHMFMLYTDTKNQLDILAMFKIINKREKKEVVVCDESLAVSP